eukprot:840048-Pelagomonas_calceolata.AAC.1
MLAIVLILGLLFVLSLLLVSPSKPRKTRPVRTMIVLGSGGHTAEMLRATAALDKSCYRPRIYVYAATDNFSANKASEAEKVSPSGGEAPDFSLRSIPRSREVGQSYVTSVLTTLRAIAFAFVVVWREQPDVVGRLSLNST